MIRLIPLVFFFLILNITPMEAQQQIDLPDFGLSFTIPEGWTGDEQDDYIVLGHSSIPGIMFLSENPSKDAKRLKDKAMKGIAESGLFLNPEAEFTIKSESRVEGMYEGTYNGMPVRSYAVGLINGLGKGMSVMILTTSDQFSDVHKIEVEKLVNSVKFYEARDSKATMDWKNQLIGRQLKYVDSNSSSDYSGGYSSVSTTRTINLCSNGQFTYYFNSNSSYAAGSPVDGITTGNQVGSGVFQSNKENFGTYKIYSLGSSTYLELNFANDTQLEFELGINSEGNLTLDGNRYLVLDLEDCE